MMKTLLILSAAIEIGAGLGLLVAPATVVWLLLGSSFDSPIGMVVARVAGAALLSLGVACWLGRQQGASVHGLIAAMLLYNIAVATVLGFAGGSNMAGIVLWPAVGIHAVMAVWCLSSLRGMRVGLRSGVSS